MARPKRSQQRPDLQAAIKDVARKQIAEYGAARLSLRAIARELSITAPAIYNYYPSRDDLVTALIVDAYHSLAAALGEARDANHEDHAGSIIASANAYREWALTYPEQYGFIFGTPIPGYHAPMEIIGPAAARSMAVLISVIDAAWQDDALAIGDALPGTSEIVQTWIDKFSYNGPPAVIHFAMASWALIHGLVSLEIFGHLTAAQEDVDVDTFFEIEIHAMVTRMGLNKTKES